MLSGCFSSPEVECTSVCGAKLYGSDDCEGFNLIEQKTIYAFESIYGGENVCNKLKNVSVELRDTPNGYWTDEKNRKLAGVCICEGFGTLIIMSLDWKTNAYAHEVAHWMDTPYVNYDHVDWDINGVYAAIAETQK